VGPETDHLCVHANPPLSVDQIGSAKDKTGSLSQSNWTIQIADICDGTNNHGPTDRRHRGNARGGASTAPDAIVPFGQHGAPAWECHCLGLGWYQFIFYECFFIIFFFDRNQSCAP
jgi:hypothetical protein